VNNTFLKNRAYIEFYKQGLIIGNNNNIQYGVESVKNNEEEEDEKFAGALVANPLLNSHVGIEILGKKSKFIFDNIIDMDFSAMYPSIIICFNIEPNSMIGKLIIETNKELPNYIEDIDDKGKKEDIGKIFVDNMLTGDLNSLGHAFFNLPKLEEIDSIIKEELNIKPKSKLIIDINDVNSYYINKLVV